MTTGLWRDHAGKEILMMWWAAGVCVYTEACVASGAHPPRVASTLDTGVQIEQWLQCSAGEAAKLQSLHLRPCA